MSTASRQFAKKVLSNSTGIFIEYPRSTMLYSLKAKNGTGMYRA